MIFFWPQLVQGRVLYWGDIGLYFTPMQEFLRQNLLQGRLPLWNPLILCGTPYVGNPQTWPLYPVTALLPFVSPSYFLSLTVALHIWLAGLGTYLFARRALMFRRGPALLAAITYMFGGQLVSKEQFPNMVQAAAWLPWILLCLDRLLKRRRFADSLWLGTALGLQLLAAHPQMTALTLYLAAAWGIFTKFAPSTLSRETRKVMPIAPAIVLSFLIAVGLAAGQILPTLGLYQAGERHKLPFAYINRFFLPANELGNFILPRLHGQPYFGDWTARGNFWETCCYVGWLPFLMGVWGIVSAWRKDGSPAARFWTGVFLAGVWMAIGGSGGLYFWAYRFLPGFASFHDPARCLLWASFAFSILAGYGWERAGRPQWARIGTVMIIILAFTDLTLFGRTLYPLADPSALHPSPPNLALIMADPDIRSHQARVLAPSPGVWLRFTNYKDFRQETPDFEGRWTNTLTPNLLIPYGLRDAYGYEPVPLRNAQNTAGEAAYAFEPQAAKVEQAKAEELAGTLAVKYISLCRVQPPYEKWPGLIPLRADETISPPGRKHSVPAFIYLSQNSRWQPRAHLAGSAIAVPLIDISPDQVTLQCVTGGPDRVILADTDAAGWHAAVDGIATPIQTTGGCLRMVRLPSQGLHTVTFSYIPALFRLGLYLSLLTLCGLLACVIRNILTTEGYRVSGVE